MNKIKSYILIGLSMFTLASCNDWLDITPETEVRQDDLFSSYKGYKEALAGCYTSMASRDLYGEKLTMTDIECLANLWNTPNGNRCPELYYMHYHYYDTDETRSAIKAIYGGLYNVIVQTNAIINNLTANPSSIKGDQQRNVVEGEARAIRAFCHFDALRLFGQMPQNGERTVSLPYSESNDINILPPYYGFNDFAKKVINDLDIAEEKLAKSDPIMEYSYDQLTGTEDKPAEDTFDDDFLVYRRNRFNYWAVRALKARVYQYIGETAKAYSEAKAVIDAQLNGKKVVELAGNDDYAKGHYALPSECLFALHNSELLNYSVKLLGGDPTSRILTDQVMYVSSRNLDNKLYVGQNTTSNNRYLNLWEHNTMSSTGTKYPTIKKYFWSMKDDHKNLELRTQLQIMPILRLSEMYLIAMETTTDLSEANSLYKTYMAARNVNISDDFASLENVRTEVVNEYRREFYGEGQMFYCYKRLGEKSIMFSYYQMGDDEYILPLPESEFNPADKQ